MQIQNDSFTMIRNKQILKNKKNDLPLYECDPQLDAGFPSQWYSGHEHSCLQHLLCQLSAVQDGRAVYKSLCEPDLEPERGRAKKKKKIW